jgi:hypothetical protein
MSVPRGVDLCSEFSSRFAGAQFARSTHPCGRGTLPRHSKEVDETDQSQYAVPFGSVAPFFRADNFVVSARGFWKPDAEVPNNTQSFFDCR